MGSRYWITVNLCLWGRARNRCGRPGRRLAKLSDRMWCGIPRVGISGPRDTSQLEVKGESKRLSQIRPGSRNVYVSRVHVAKNLGIDAHVEQPRNV